MPRSVWDRLLGDRGERSRASRYVVALLEEPAPGDAEWLSAHAAAGDLDHARWELRYARRAMGLLAAERDALDDRTASVVSAALTRAMDRDPLVAPDRREIAWRQFNTRLSAYGDALAERGGSESTTLRLGRVLLGFAGSFAPMPQDLATAGTLVTGYLAGASDALRAAFGTAELPAELR